jgi:hypothetical protein
VDGKEQVEATRGLRSAIEENQVVIDKAEECGIGRFFLDRPYQELVEEEQDTAFSDVVVDAEKGHGNAGFPDMMKVFFFVVAHHKLKQRKGLE